MKKVKLLLALIVIIIIGHSSCSPDYTVRHYPTEYRTYQDAAHGGMDDQHGGKYTQIYHN